jgi:hypothetical protein
VKPIIEASLKALSTPIRYTIEEIDVDTARVVAVRVEKSSGLVAVNGSYYSRSGETTRPMRSEEIQAHISPSSFNAVIPAFAKSLEEQTKIIEQLRTEIKESHSLGNKMKEWGVGFLIGCASSFVIWKLTT